MSLNWDISKVENWQEKSENHKELLDHLIWGSLSIGMQKITKYNAKEWAYRLNRLLIENQCYEQMYSVDQIEIFIGLETNVETITASEFEKVIKRRHPERFKITKTQLNKE